MVEVEALKSLRFRVEGNQTAARGNSEGRQIRIRPETVPQRRGGSKPLKTSFKIRRLAQEDNLGIGEVMLIEIPRCPQGRWIGDHLRMSAQAEKSQHGHSAKSDLTGILLKPIVPRNPVVSMVGIR